MKRKWFRAKEKGNGWGKPLTWEGWTISVIYAAVLVIAYIWLDAGKTYESDTLANFVPVFVIATIIFAVIIFLTGEKTEWYRPGRRKQK